MPSPRAGGKHTKEMQARGESGEQGSGQTQRTGLTEGWKTDRLKLGKREERIEKTRLVAPPTGSPRPVPPPFTERLY